MAKRGSNFRGTTRTLYNPRTVKYLEIPTARKEYQDLRRVALKRAARLTKAGLDYLPEATPDLPQSSRLTDEQIQDALKDNPCGQGDEMTPIILIRPIQ